MSERVAWVWEYGIEVTTPDQGTVFYWDREDYPQGRNVMVQRVTGLEASFQAAGSTSASSARLVRRRKWTKTIVWVEKKEYAL